MKHKPIIECDNCGLMSSNHFYEWPCDNEMLDICHSCMNNIRNVVHDNKERRQELKLK